MNMSVPVWRCPTNAQPACLSGAFAEHGWLARCPVRSFQNYVSCSVVGRLPYITYTRWFLVLRVINSWRLDLYAILLSSRSFSFPRYYYFFSRAHSNWNSISVVSVARRNETKEKKTDYGILLSREILVVNCSLCEWKNADPRGGSPERYQVRWR